MREIKFRAWDDYHKKMLVVHNLYQHMDADGFTEFECTPKGWSKDGKDYILVSTTAHDNVKIMQYTGLEDKNGVEIYEGDIVTFRDCCGRTLTKKVEWIEEDAGFYPFGADYGCGDTVGTDHEVIGNIYENSKLLKEREDE